MISQSFAIITVILVMIFMFLRGGRKAGALFSAPLLSVPVFHLAGAVLRNLAGQDLFQRLAINVGFDIAGFVLGAALCWIMARAISVRTLRYAYFASCAVFMGLLAAAYISAQL